MPLFEELMEAAREGNVAKMQQLLEKDPELLHKTGDHGESPLMAALYHGHQQAVQWLLALGATVNVHEAAALGDTDALRVMLEYDRRLVSELSFDGWTPLHLACFFGGYDTAAFLLEKGADVNAPSANALASRPIHAAAAGGRTAIVELLLKHGADPNARQKGGITPLHQAVQHCDRGMALLLLHHGADRNAADDEGTTPWQLARQLEYDTILEIFEKQ